MKKIIKINFICLLVLVICSLSFLSFAVENMNENGEMPEEILPTSFPEYDKEYDNQLVEDEDLTDLDKLKTQKTDLEEDVSNSFLVMGMVQSQMTEILMEVERLNLTILEQQAEIEKLEAQQVQLEEEIGINESNLEMTTEIYNDKKAILEERLVALYEMGKTTYLDMLLHSKSLTEFLSNYYMISEIAKVDQDLITSFSRIKADMERLAKSLANNKIILEQSKDAKEKANIVLQNNLVIQNNKLEQLTEEERSMHDMIAEYQEELSKLESEIRLLSLANVEAEYVGGVMDWPVPGYTRITSRFGMRTHPITGIYKLHTGVDIGAPMGSQFVAANDGLVVKAGYNVAYGNMVILDHGGGIQTLYAHGSEILVEVGDIVTQGTPILAVGSTGYSTGPHAHFEVRINGEYVEPLDYITSYNIKSMEQAVKDLDEGPVEKDTADEETEELDRGTNEMEEENE